VINVNDEIYHGLSSPHLKELFGERELQIMEAALEVFAEKGYHASSTREISQKAGIAEGTIFRYFKTKKDILNRLATALFDKFLAPLVIDAIDEILTTYHDRPIEEVIQHLIRDRLTLIRANFRYIHLFIYEMQFQSDFRKNVFEEIIWKVSSKVTNYFEEKQQKGLIRVDLNCRAIVFSLVGMVASFVLWHEFLHGDEKYSFSDEEIISQVTKIILHGIQVD
jgi:AcrR family transcriptional regulator